MSLVALDGTPLVPIGIPLAVNNQQLAGATSTLQDAAKEATISFGYVITDDGASHTIDTTGSSSLGWRSGAVTNANASTRFVVGLATMDTTTGPPGRATNVSDVITPSVSITHIGNAGTITANAWQTNVPDTGTMTVANGDFISFFTQMTVLGGADAINTQTSTVNVGQDLPGVVSYTGGSYAQVGSVPNCLITFSDGHLGWVFGGSVWVTNTTSQTWNSGSATKEYGNFIQLPFPTKIYGLISNAIISGNSDLILYSDPLGTPFAEKTVSVDLNTISGANGRRPTVLFSSPYSAALNQPLAMILKPTSGTNVTLTYKTFNASAHQVTEPGGTNCYAVSRASGAFAAVNSNKDRFSIGLLVGAFDVGGISRARAASGF